MSRHPSPNPAMEIIASDEGFVVHDADGNVVHYLNQTAAIIYSLCDGHRSTADIARMLRDQFDLDAPPEEDVARTLDDLEERGIVL